MKITEKLARLVPSVLMPSQSELSRQTGISQSALSMAIAGKQRLYGDQILLIAKALGVSCDYLLDYGLEEIPQPEFTDDERFVIRLMRDLGITAGDMARRMFALANSGLAALGTAGPAGKSNGSALEIYRPGHGTARKVSIDQ